MCYTISKSFVLNFVLIIMLLALDFWTVKNVTGRFLVGKYTSTCAAQQPRIVEEFLAMIC